MGHEDESGRCCLMIDEGGFGSGALPRLRLKAILLTMIQTLEENSK
jgi:hypothetical protein